MWKGKACRIFGEATPQIQVSFDTDCNDIVFVSKISTTSRTLKKKKKMDVPFFGIAKVKCADAKAILVTSIKEERRNVFTLFLALESPLFGPEGNDSSRRDGVKKASKKVSFIDKAAVVTTTSNTVQEYLEGSRTSVKEINAAVMVMVKVKSGSRLVMVKFQAPEENPYNLTAYCLSGTWICCDKKVNIKLKVGKHSGAGTKAMIAKEGTIQKYRIEDMTKAHTKIMKVNIVMARKMNKRRNLIG
eukprot:Gb_26379 [translate_table: standard]